MLSARTASRRIAEGLAVALVAVLLQLGAGVAPSSAADPPAPLPGFTWGSKPSGMVVSAFESVHVSYWDEDAQDYRETTEPGGLMVWPRGCQEATCWQRLLEDSSASHPAWSPSGYQVAYLHGQGEARELRVLDTRTGETRAVATGNFTMSRPTWSPDEQHLAWSEGEQFHYDDGSVGYRHGLWQVPADGSLQPVRLRHDPETAMPPCPFAGAPVDSHVVQRVNPSWSRAGELLYVRGQSAAGGDFAFCYSALPTAASAGPGALGAETGQQDAAFHYGGGMADQPDWYAVWSPDGERMLVTGRWDADDVDGIFPAPGRSGEVIPAEIDGFGAPSWAPDDKFIVRGWNLYLPNGEEWPREVPHPDPPGGLDVLIPNPDGIFTPPGLPTGSDAQCLGGSCLSGIAATLDGTADTVARVELTGDLTGRLDDLNRSAFRAVPSGTYQVTGRVDTGDVPAALTGITCDDANSGGDPATGTVTYRVDAGEVVTCRFSVNRPDQDGDGWYDDVDPCPDDPTNRCEEEPEPEPEPEPERCRTLYAQYEARLGHAKGHRMFVYSLDDLRWCWAEGKVTVRNRGKASSGKLYSGGFAALMETLGVEFKHHRSSKVAVRHFAHGGAEVAVRGKYRYCTQVPVPLLGAVLKAFRKVVPKRVRKLVAKLGSKAVLRNPLVPKKQKVRLVRMAVRKAIDRAKKLTKGEKRALRVLAGQLTDLSQEKVLKAVWNGVCLPQPVWTPEIRVAIDRSGRPTVSEHGVSGVFHVRPYRS